MQAKTTKKTNTVLWNELESYVPQMEPIRSGYSDARRGIITTTKGLRLFIKVGTSKASQEWAQKEIKVYNFLNQNHFYHTAQLVATNDDKTSFALKTLETRDGWDWSRNWNDARVTTTLRVLDELAVIAPPNDNLDVIAPVLSTSVNGWFELLRSKDRKMALHKKLAERKLTEITKRIERLAELTANFKFKKEALVHNDVRADNCTWNEQTGEVKLVDWNLLEFGDRRIDQAVTLTHIHQCGYEVLDKHSERLDREALYWIAGFWFISASKPVWPGGNESLRDFQLNLGIAALDLADKLK